MPLERTSMDSHYFNTSTASSELPASSRLPREIQDMIITKVSGHGTYSRLATLALLAGASKVWGVAVAARDELYKKITLSSRGATRLLKQIALYSNEDPSNPSRLICLLNRVEHITVDGVVTAEVTDAAHNATLDCPIFTNVKGISWTASAWNERHKQTRNGKQIAPDPLPWLRENDSIARCVSLAHNSRWRRQDGLDDDPLPDFLAPEMCRFNVDIHLSPGMDDHLPFLMHIDILNKLVWFQQLKTLSEQWPDSSRWELVNPQSLFWPESFTEAMWENEEGSEPTADERRSLWGKWADENPPSSKKLSVSFSDEGASVCRSCGTFMGVENALIREKARPFIAGMMLRNHYW